MTREAVKQRLFGTNGVRGVLGDGMTPDLALRIGAAFGSLRKGRVAVGRDTRTSGDTLLNALKAGLLLAGCEVTDCGILPTPALQFIVRGGFTGGAMVTASHNPPEYNGIKAIDADGTEMGDEETGRLEEAVFQRSFTATPWNSVGHTRTAPYLIDRYTDAIVGQFPPGIGSGMLVAVDPGSGPACRTTPEILRRIGCRVLTVNGTMDGTFPGRLPEPSEEGLAPLANLVVSSGAAFGVAHDGDADRAVFLDEQGRYVEENAEFALVAQHVSRKKKGLVVAPISTSRAVEAVVKEEGCSIVYTKVGSIHVARTMHALIREGNTVIFGGEGNGGLIYPDHQFCRDGGMTAATMVAILRERHARLSELVSGLPRHYMLKGKVTTLDAAQVVETVGKKFSGDIMDRIDGLKIIRNEAWALIRASGTEPLIRVVVESRDRRQASDFYQDVMNAIAHAQKNP